MKTTGADTPLPPPPGFFSSQIQEARRFVLALRPQARTGLSVVCGGLEHCAAGYHVERRTFRYYSVEYVAGGRGTVVLDGKKYSLGPGQVFSYGPRIGHVIESDPRQRLVKYFVDFTGGNARRLLEQCGLKAGTLVQTSAPGWIGRWFEELIETGERRGQRSAEICGLMVEQMLHRVYETAIPAGSLESKAFATFERCRGYIEAHAVELQEVGDAAKACDVDVAYLCRLFQRFEKRGAYQYLMQVKMARAARILQEPGVLVKQVAGRMGFRDQFQFSRAFRRVHGVSPREMLRLKGSGRG